ncbi:MAG: glutaredoxin family protein [Planctomycetota bacterium]
MDARAAGDDEPLRVVVFTSSTCAHCAEVDTALAAAEREWGARIEIQRHDLAKQPEAVGLLFAYAEQYGTPDRSLPQIFVGTQAVTGSDDLPERLNAAIDAELAAGHSTPVPPPNTARRPGAGADADKTLARRRARLSAGGIAAAGLRDAVTACGLAAVLLLAAMLTYLRGGRREVLTVGGAFTGAVLLSRVLPALTGIGRSSMIPPQAGEVIAWVVAAAALGLSGQSFIACLRSWPARRAPRPVAARWLAVGAAVAGFATAPLGALCTVRAYLPTLERMIATPGLRGEAVAYVLLYGASFILPLAVIAAGWVVAVRAPVRSGRDRAAVALVRGLLLLSLVVLVMATV